VPTIKGLPTRRGQRLEKQSISSAASGSKKMTGNPEHRAAVLKGEGVPESGKKAKNSNLH